MLVVHEEVHILEKLVKHIFPFLIYFVILLSLHLSYSLQEHFMRAETTWLKRSSPFSFPSFSFLVSILSDSSSLLEDKGRGWLDAVPDSQGAMWLSMNSLTVLLHAQRRICPTSPDMVSKIQMSVSRLKLSHYQEEETGMDKWGVIHLILGRVVPKIGQMNHGFKVPCSADHKDSLGN